MVHIVDRENRHLYAEQLNQMHKIRHEVFVERRGWRLNCDQGREYDQFDTDDTVYMIDIDRAGTVQGSVRFLRTTGPTIISSIFPHLCTEPPPCSEFVWESSRGHVSPLATDPTIWSRIMLAELEFSVLWGVEKVVFVIDTFLLPKWLAAGWVIDPLGPPTIIEGESYIACSLNISPLSLRNMRDRYGIKSPSMTYVRDLPNVA